jgi:hypothetical protein
MHASAVQRKSGFVELRLFAGLNVEETAEVMGRLLQDGEARMEAGTSRA